MPVDSVKLNTLSDSKIAKKPKSAYCTSRYCQFKFGDRRKTISNIEKPNAKGIKCPDCNNILVWRTPYAFKKREK